MNAPTLEQLLASKRAQIATAKDKGKDQQTIAQMKDEAEVLERFIQYALKISR
jgi:hypothetical protein